MCTMQVHAEANKTALHRAPPELWPRLGTEEVRGPSSEAVSAGVAGTAADSAAVSAGAVDSAAVETLLAPLVSGVQKPPLWVGKRFWDRFAAAPLKVSRPRGVRMTPAWARRNRLGARPVVGRGGVGWARPGLGPTWSVKEWALRLITAKRPSYSGCSGGTAPLLRI
jgi:hypothetical protein